MTCYSRFLVFPLFISGRQMFLSPLSLVCVCECMTTFMYPPHPPLKSMHIYFIQNCFRLISSNVHPLNLTEQMFLFSKQIAPRLISQKQLSLKKKREQERHCFLFSLSSSEDRYLKEIYKDRGELTVLCRGWKWQAKKKGLNAWRQRRKCKTEKNQKGDLLYLFQSSHNLQCCFN